MIKTIEKITDYKNFSEYFVINYSSHSEYISSVKDMNTNELQFMTSAKTGMIKTENTTYIFYY